MITSRCLHYIHDHKSIRDAWLAIQNDANYQPVFSTYEYFYALSSVSSEKYRNRLICICVYKESKPVAILPFYQLRLGPIVIYLAPHQAITDYWMPAITQEFTEDERLKHYIMELILAKLNLFLPYVPESIIDKKTFQSSAYPALAFKSSVRYFINTQSKESYEAIHRKSFARLSKEEKRTKYQFNTKGYTRDLLFADNVMLKHAQCSATGSRSLYSDKKNFAKLVHLLKLDCTIVPSLTTKTDTLAATGIHFLTQSVLTYYQPSYTTRSKIYSPGRMLLLRLIKACLETNREFDFSLGDEDYKRQYATNVEMVYAIVAARFCQYPLAALAYLLYSFESRNMIRKIFHRIKRNIRSLSWD